MGDWWSKPCSKMGLITHLSAELVLQSWGRPLLTHSREPTKMHFNYSQVELSRMKGQEEDFSFENSPIRVKSLLAAWREKQVVLLHQIHRSMVVRG